ncbi:hypothetical protein ACOSP7_031568 [Xanthoceras sorbifolium]
MSNSHTTTPLVNSRTTLVSTVKLLNQQSKTLKELMSNDIAQVTHTANCTCFETLLMSSIRRGVFEYFKTRAERSTNGPSQIDVATHLLVRCSLSLRPPRHPARSTSLVAWSTRLQLGWTHFQLGNRKPPFVCCVKLILQPRSRSWRRRGSKCWAEFVIGSVLNTERFEGSSSWCDYKACSITTYAQSTPSAHSTSTEAQSTTTEHLENENEEKGQDKGAFHVEASDRTSGDELLSDVNEDNISEEMVKEICSDE